MSNTGNHVINGKTSSRNDVRKRTRSSGLLLTVLITLFLIPKPASAQDQETSASDAFWGTWDAAADSLPSHDGYWGTIPARSDTVSALMNERPRPAWETTAMVPYWIIGIPFRILWFAGDGAITGMDKLGLFGQVAEHPGIKGPFGSYLMPTISIGDLEGWTFGLNLTRYDFFGPDNLLFLRASVSTRYAEDLAGGTLFRLGPDWEMQVGAGTEETNLTRYYGLGPESIKGDLSYYYRHTAWGGFEVDRNLGGRTDLGLRSTFTKLETREPRYRTDESLDTVHGDDPPTGYPGESHGWTLRLALTRDNAPQTGRPESGGFQDVAVSLFVPTDGQDIQHLVYHVDLEKFFPLWHTKRTLAVRGFFNKIDNLGSEEIPFARLVTFQRPDELRGFGSMRFYGMGSLGISLEYRWPMWVARGRDDTGLDAYLFSDNGQVYDRASEISLENFQFTGGVGLRFIDSGRGFGARFELGLSDERTVVRLKFSQTFQYAPKGLLYGKNPTKIR